MRSKKLVIISPASAEGPAKDVLCSDDIVRLSAKFVSGVSEYQKHWPGPIHVVMPPRPARGIEDIEVPLESLPFELTIAEPSSAGARSAIRDAALVLFSVQVGHNPVARLCRDFGVPHIGITEYSLRTRLQIAQAEAGANFPRLAKRQIQERLWERENIGVIKSIDGVQCNGIPTFENYRALNKSPILYFDTRVSRSELVDRGALETKLSHRRASGRPLRLAFSGRLVAMKGASDLIDVAAELRKRGAPFELAIYGDGELRPSMQQRIDELALRDVVTLKGAVDFKTALLPAMREDVDIFVCCHPQGDPSCTYLETMSCGVPIVSYGNEAFVGIQSLSHGGWEAPMRRPDLVADIIGGLRPEMIDDASRNALAFAEKHTFEGEFDRRMQHARNVAGLE